MITRYRINSKSWTPITAMGESGSCWAEKNRSGNGVVLISHSSTGTPSKSHGFRLWKPINNSDVCLITADDQSDIFYARVVDAKTIIDRYVDV